MTELIQSALAEAERASKKQKLCAETTAQCIDALISELSAAQWALEASTSGTQGRDVMQQVHTKLQGLDIAAQLAANTLALHSSVNKLSKAIDKAFVADICKANRDIDFDKPTLDRVLAEHFFQTGRFKVGKSFIKEVGFANGEQLKRPFEAMYEVLKEINKRNLAPALDWATQHRSELAAAGTASGGFEFRLHRLQFLHLLDKQGPRAALGYARQHFGAFKATQMHEIQRLMGCLCFARRPGTNPYLDLLAASQWDDIAREFAQQCCGLLGQAYESPLLVSVAAGSVALPTLLKLTTLMAPQVQSLQDCTQLPVELELGREFVFRTIFACPVSRDQSAPDNPPMMLPCGHVLCKVSIEKIAKNAARTFKCPYCPAEATVNACRQLYFPDAA